MNLEGLANHTDGEGEETARAETKKYKKNMNKLIWHTFITISF